MTKPEWEIGNGTKEPELFYNKKKMNVWLESSHKSTCLSDYKAVEELICNTAKSRGGGTVNYALESAVVAFARSVSIIALM